MRVIVFGALLALVAACAAPTVPTAGPEEIEAQRKMVFACHVREAPRYDDHASDAATVGAAVAHACSVESERWFAAQVRGQGDSRADALRRVWNGLNRDLATQVVLALRANRL